MGRELAERVRDGDSSAIGRIFEAHRPRLRTFLARMLDPRLNSRVSTSDVVQDVYVDVHRQIEGFLRQPRVPFAIWLRGIATQRVSKLRRAHLQAARRSLTREQHPVTTSPVPPIQQFVATDPSPSEQVLKREAATQVQIGLSRLKSADRSIIMWRHYEGKSNSEVAQVLGISDSAATMRYVRALTRLQAIMRAISEGGGCG